MEKNLLDKAFPGARTKRSKLGAKSRKKGVDNEKVLAKKLTEWVGVKFIRTPGSGSLGKLARFLRMDIMVTEGTFPFGIETKRYAKMTDNKLYSIWQKACSEHEHPLVFVKLDGMRYWWIYTNIDLGLPVYHNINELYAYSSIDLFKTNYNDFINFCRHCYGIGSSGDAA